MSQSSAVPCPVHMCNGIVFVAAPRIYACTGREQHSHGAIVASFDLEEAHIDEQGQNADDALERRLDPLEWRRRMIAKAADVAGEGRRFRPPKGSELEEPPTYPSGILSIGADAPLSRFRGVTVCSGKASSGKTWCAIPASIDAAREGWNVRYVAAEGPAVVWKRAGSLCRRDPLPDSWDLVTVQRGVTVADFVQMVSDAATTRRTLIVVDSISSIAGLMVASRSQSGMMNQAELSDLEMFMLGARQHTAGEVSFLVTSEANASGETKGRTLDHRADMSVNFESEDIGEDEIVKQVRVRKSWWARDCQKLPHMIDARIGRLVELDVGSVMPALPEDDSPWQ